MVKQVGCLQPKQAMIHFPVSLSWSLEAVSTSIKHYLPSWVLNSVFRRGWTLEEQI